MELPHATEIDGADDIDIMENEGVFDTGGGLLLKEPSRLF
jgi:hypothetical protein